jgi:hypothetical protein
VPRIAAPTLHRFVVVNAKGLQRQKVAGTFTKCARQPRAVETRTFFVHVGKPVRKDFFLSSCPSCVENRLGTHGVVEKPD